MKSIKKCYKMLSVAVAAVLLFGLSATKVYAASNYYGIAQNSQGGDGSYFYATIKSLDANWSLSTTYNFILLTQTSHTV